MRRGRHCRYGSTSTATIRARTGSTGCRAANAAAGRVLAGHARDVAAHTVAVGRSPRGSFVQFADGSPTVALTSAAPCPVVYVQSDGTPHLLTPQTMHNLRSA